MMAFAKVWKNRAELTGLFNPFNENPFEGRITTEIDVTTYARYPSSPSSPYAEDVKIVSPGGIKVTDCGTYDPYSVNIEVGPNNYQRQGSGTEIFKVRSLTRNHALSETNPDAWLYARVAFLFFCSLLICWVPASINRLYSLARPDSFIFGLNYTETLILPLQGFFNATVYAITSQTACRNLWRSMTGAEELPRKSSIAPSANGVGMCQGSTKLERMGIGKTETRSLERSTSRRTSERLENEALPKSLI